MNIIDIVNKDNQTLERCDQEPIHIPGAIQPHGFLITIDGSPERIIRFGSGNLEGLLGRKLSGVLGFPINTVLSSAHCLKLEEHLKNEMFDTGISCEIAGTAFNIAIHRSGSLFTLEFEPFPDGSADVAEQFNQTKRFLRNIQNAASFQQICQSVAEETRSITGYDRVMIYRFDKDYNGEVYAESKRPDLLPFLGHHYPHTDIPAQARELYLKNLLRIIADVHYTPVPIFTLDDPSVSNKQLDMSESVLRSVSPIHIEYLKNMGVGATLTISLVQDKRLWGLIACHHYAPKHLPFYTRMAAQLQGHFLTSQISVRQAAEENELTSILEKKLGDVLPEISGSENFLNDDSILSKITEVINATGVAIIRNGAMRISGTVPSNQQIFGLLVWLRTNSNDGNFVTSMLPFLFEPALEYGRDGSGVLYYNLGNAEKDGIIWFRSEMDKTINWAGNPTKALASDGHGNTAVLTPRKSFELWQEKVKNKSQEWLKPELNIAVKLAHILQGQFHSLYLEEEERRYIALTETLKKTNAELSNINWIGTHDLKEPLRKIQIFASRILQAEHEVSPMVIDSVNRMRKSATRMQSLITDLLQYSKASAETHEDAFKRVDLDAVVSEVLEELEEDIKEKKASVSKGTLPTITGIPFQLSQLFVNILGNSLKFFREHQHLAIEITAEEVMLDRIRYHKVTVADNGIGLRDIQPEKMFNVFQRHPDNKYLGTGIGLAICKRIMENHSGHIVAVSNSKGGASFELYFPL